MNDQVVQVRRKVLARRAFTKGHHDVELALKGLGIESERGFAVAVEDEVGIDFHCLLPLPTDGGGFSCRSEPARDGLQNATFIQTARSYNGISKALEVVIGKNRLDVFSIEMVRVIAQSTTTGTSSSPRQTVNC